MRTVPPLVAAYLADLYRRLSGADPAERADIVDSVREHIDVALDELEHEPTSDDVRRVLADLGTVDAVAAAWSPDAPPDPTVRRSVTDSPGGIVLVALGGSMLGLVLAPVSLALLVIPLAVLVLAVVASVGWVRKGAGWKAWRTIFVATVPVLLVTGVVTVGLTAVFSTTESVGGDPQPIVSAPPAP
ncbi:hypothetical protein ASF78_13810 [Cellulomonas sp. Leaf334]|nr:hypothetical protein ASF78_13810 [Cellulomonas sp. Leaf334]